MMQDIKTVGHPKSGPYEGLSVQSLAALLALAGSKQLEANSLRARMKLNIPGFRSLMDWLQREYLVDIVCSLEGEQVKETVELTDLGESVLLGLLERMCELPEFR